jgi:hypothetical protein
MLASDVGPRSGSRGFPRRPILVDVTERIRTLGVRVDISDGSPTAGDLTVTLLVDGAELFGIDEDGIGADPAQLLGPDSLLLSDGPTDVVVRICVCGEEGCGATSVRVRRDGPLVRWDRWTGSLPLARPLPSLTFDATQYAAVLSVPAPRLTRARRRARHRPAPQCLPQNGGSSSSGGGLSSTSG